MGFVPEPVTGGAGAVVDFDPPLPHPATNARESKGKTKRINIREGWLRSVIRAPDLDK
jgi:hypothetical protein